MTTELPTLVTYGPNLISGGNKDFDVSYESSRSTSPVEVQTIPIARGRGASVVNTRVMPKSIRLSGKLTSPSTSDIQETLRRLHAIFDKGDQFLRIVPEYKVITDTSSASGWTAADDTTNVALNSSNYQYGSSSIGFDITVATSVNNYSTISNSALTQVDLSTISASGNFEFWIYLPSVEYVTTLDFRVGNDSSNYLGVTGITQDYQYKALANGWNLISIPYSSLSTTGSLTFSAIDYLYVRVNYSSSQANMTGNYINGFLWVKESRAREYKCFRQSTIGMDGNYFNTDYGSTSIELLNYSGMGESTHPVSAYSASAIATNPNSQSLTFDGSISPLPVLNISFATANQITGLTLTNNSNGQFITINSTITSGDSVAIGGITPYVQKNGVNVDFTGYIPDFDLAYNRMTLQLSSTSGVVITNTVQDSTVTEITSINSAYLAQSFTASLTGIINIAKIQAYKVNTGSGGGINLYATIQTDSAGSPSGTIVGNVTFKVIGTTLSWVTLAGLNISVTNGTGYWLVIPTYFGDASNNTQIFIGDSTGSSFANGQAKRYNGSAWSAITNADLDFEIDIQPLTAATYTISLAYKKLYV